MAILRSMDGKFFDVPDDDLESLMIPAEEVKEKLGEAGGPGPGGPSGGMGSTHTVPGGGQVVIQVFPNAGGSGGGPPQSAEGGEGGGDVQAQSCGGWRNCWRSNCWRNCY